MGNMAVDLMPVTAVQEFGELTQTDGRLIVRTKSGAYRARRALSCLIEPLAGDRVLVAFDSPDAVYVLAVLERTSAAPSRVIFDGDAEIYTPAGRLEFGARDGIALASPQVVEVTSNELRVNAVDASLTVEKAAYAGQWLSACVGSIKLVATSLDAVMDRWTQRVRQSLRRVDELEQVKAGQIDYAARDTLALHGNNALMTAKKLVKVDGEQIHLA